MYLGYFKITRSHSCFEQHSIISFQIFLANKVNCSKKAMQLKVFSSISAFLIFSSYYIFIESDSRGKDETWEDDMPEPNWGCCNYMTCALTTKQPDTPISRGF